MATNGVVTRLFSQNGQEPTTLDGFCENAGLLLGQYALARGMNPLAYFKRYGLDERGFAYLLRSSDLFRTHYCYGVSHVDAALALFSREYGLRKTWCPQYIHVWEKIKERYPLFSWTIDYERRDVVYQNYPREAPGKSPTLLQLVSGEVMLDPVKACLIPKVKRGGNKKTSSESILAHRRRRRSEIMGCWA